MIKRKYKIGDRVRIMNPEFFIRVGYPLTLDDAYENIEGDWKSLIQKINQNSPNYFKITEKMKFQLRRDLAYSYLQTKSFGGNERKLYTVKLDNPHYYYEYFTIVSKKVVKTGKYGYEQVDDEDYDYCRCPSFKPVLTNQKTHVILELDHEFHYDNEESEKILVLGNYTRTIESCNVIKYEDYTNNAKIVQKLMR